MTDPDTKDKPESGAKFLFDLHNFDVPDEPEEDEDLPPPPTFYQEDIEKAMKDGYQQGKLDGVVEAEGKREQFVAQILETISKETPSLFHNEKIRYDTFEKEVLLLSKALFEAILPTLKNSFAIYEIEKLIKNTLETHQDVPEIIIEVHPEYKTDVEKHVNETVNPQFQHGKITIAENPAIEEHNCFVKWADGGAYRDSNAIVKDVMANFEGVIQASGCEELLKQYDDTQPPIEETTSSPAMNAPDNSDVPQAPEPKAETPLQNDQAPDNLLDKSSGETNETSPCAPDVENTGMPDVETDKEVDLSPDMAHNQESLVESEPEAASAPKDAETEQQNDETEEQILSEDTEATPIESGQEAKDNEAEAEIDAAQIEENIADTSAEDSSNTDITEQNQAEKDDGDTP